jgi:hypothetical protein
MANRLYRHESDGTFTSITGQPIVSDVTSDLASVWADFDNDGDLDCFVATDGARADRLYENHGDGTFTETAGTPLTATAFATRGATAGDYDNDGDVDLFVYAPLGNRALYRNDASGSHWLSISLSGAPSNRSAIGARVRVKAILDGTPVWQRRDVSAQNTFQGQNDLRAHFGLRDATVADSVEICWPDGSIDVRTGVGTNQFLNISESDPAGVGNHPGAGETALAWSPHPFRNDVLVNLRLPAGTSGSLSIYDAAGRRVRAFQLAPGGTALRWDGEDELGRAVAPGVYLIRLDAGRQSRSGKLVRVR